MSQRGQYRKTPQIVANPPSPPAQLFPGTRQSHIPRHDESEARALSGIATHAPDSHHFPLLLPLQHVCCFEGSATHCPLEHIWQSGQGPHGSVPPQPVSMAPQEFAGQLERIGVQGQAPHSTVVRQLLVTEPHLPAHVCAGGSGRHGWGFGFGFFRPLPLRLRRPLASASSGPSTPATPPRRGNDASSPSRPRRVPAERNDRVRESKCRASNAISEVDNWPDGPCDRQQKVYP